MHFGEDLCNFRDDEGYKKKEDTSSNQRHKDWIGQGCLKATSQGLLMFTEFCQTTQNHIKRS